MPPALSRLSGALACAASALAASLSLSHTVGSSMVLQRDVPTSSLWGTADAGAVVTATLSTSPGAPVPATAGADGVWRVQLPAMTATPAPFSITFSSPGASSITISDVIVGDVVLCRLGGRARTAESHVFSLALAHTLVGAQLTAALS